MIKLSQLQIHIRVNYSFNQYLIQNPNNLIINKQIKNKKNHQQLEKHLQYKNYNNYLNTLSFLSINHFRIIVIFIPKYLLNQSGKKFRIFLYTLINSFIDLSTYPSIHLSSINKYFQHLQILDSFQQLITILLMTNQFFINQKMIQKQICLAIKIFKVPQSFKQIKTSIYIENLFN
ncbi:hypothetical protein ABPG72_002874 [Tetrahymena utriculariae]